MNKKYIAIVVLVVVVISLFCLANYVKDPVQVNQVQSASKEISQEELLSQNWMSKPPHLSNDTLETAVKNYHKSQHATSSLWYLSGQILTKNIITNEYYVGVFAGGSSRDGFPELRVYSASFANVYHEIGYFGKVNLIDQSGLSNDGSSLGFVERVAAPDNTAWSSTQEGTPKFDEKLILIDLKNNSLTNILLPGSVREFWDTKVDKKRFITDSWFNVIIGAWRFVGDNSVEFTKYFTASAEMDAQNEINPFKEPIQISDKELWSYDRTTGKLTLLETIPLKK